MTKTDPVLEWDKPMTSKQAAKYHLTGGFVTVELYRAQQRSHVELLELLRVETQFGANDGAMDLGERLLEIERLCCAALAQAKEGR